ncbi:tRNA-dependent cyclodipeptide synthase [Agarilytica rhodophyticola]|uniref:tRNA-dependent cyclodipeptide synthase n=1 Tax=Agarilytica rhodophyticola TaxID=1737490 RepID=UPI000B348E95|nr:tRNA-dependent cyclodipeptide synthase [Agarilytica rhodophyticola]
MKNQIIIPLNQSNNARYKAEVRTCVPAEARADISTYKSCFVGISLENPSFIGSKLASIVDWISNRFSDCTFLLGDNVHRLTLQIRKDLGAEDSLNHALGLGDYYLRTHQHILKNTKTGKPFKVIRGAEIYDNCSVIKYHEALQTLFKEQESFREAVRGFARQFILRAESFDILATENAVNLSCRYVLEELAETCYMISLGHNTLVYPGSLAIFEQISEGCFVGLPKELDKLVNIGLRLKRRGKKPVAQPLSAS